VWRGRGFGVRLENGWPAANEPEARDVGGATRAGLWPGGGRDGGEYSLWVLAVSGAGPKNPTTHIAEKLGNAISSKRLSDKQGTSW